MTPEEYAKVKAIFLEAVEISPDQRTPWLNQVCGEHTPLRKQVDNLLRHHFPKSVLPESELSVLKELPSTHQSPTQSHFSIPRLRLWPHRLVGRNRTLLLWTLPFSVGIITLGGWFYSQINQAFNQRVVDQLELGLNAEVNAVELWIGQQKLEAEQQVLNPAMQAAALELIQLAQVEPFDKKALANAPARAQLYYELEPYFQRPQIAFATLLDPTGVHLAESGPDHQENIGTTLNRQAREWIKPTLERGETIFIPPFIPPDVMDDLPEWVDERMPSYLAVATPLRDQAGNIAAVMVFGSQGHEVFSQLFEMANIGKTAEAYAFNRDGRMLSRSRFNRLLIEAQPSLPKINSSRELFLQVRNPGGNLLSDFQPEGDSTAWPLTLLAETALNHQLDHTEVTTGTLLTPYLNYRGARVVGAWTWLPDYGLGVAFEIEAQEVYGPLRLINTALLGIAGVTLLGIVWAAWSALTASKLNHQSTKAQQMGRYKLIKKIDEGGMGEVYLSRHALLKRPTAIKILKGNNLSKEIVARFNREVQIASQIDHPNIIDIFDFGYTPEGTFYYVMEYIDGFNLAELVAMEGPLPPTRVIHILLRICDALDEAHHAGLIHRDIKPSNIMVYRRGRLADAVKLLDFGLAKSLNPEESLDETHPFYRAGTPRYMAPERWSDRQKVDVRSDIYSIGALAYYLLSGQAPFQGVDVTDLLYQVMRETPKPLSDLSLSPLPEALDSLVMRCLAKDPEHRPQALSVLLSTLEHLQTIYPWSQEDAMAWWEEMAKFNRATNDEKS
jgi:tRNA A-37 threonylcarbamoyl transferase component Bud32